MHTIAIQNGHSFTPIAELKLKSVMEELNSLHGMETVNPVLFAINPPVVLAS